MTLLALIPGLISALYTFFRSPERAFLAVYLPVLLLLPQAFRAEIFGLPDVTMAQAAIIPIFVAFSLIRIQGWKFSITDLLIAVYIGCCMYSQYINTWNVEADGDLAVNLLADKVTSNIFPYMLAKKLIDPLGLTEQFAKRYAFLMFINVLLCVFEFRFGFDPYIIYFQRIFVGQAENWPTLFRYGLVRIAGPFVQPILFGIGLAIANLLNIWLIKNRLWKYRFKLLPPMPVSKAVIMAVVLGIGMVLTWSRGPLVAFIFGVLFIGIPFAKNPWKSLLLRLGAIGVLSFIAYSYYQYYGSIDSRLAQGDEGSAAYRALLVSKYEQYIAQKPLWGWGFTTWPKASGFDSIDNAFLLLIVMHGYITLASFVAIIAWMMGRLLLRGLLTPSTHKQEASLAFTFFACFVTMTISLITVYMGMQIEPIFFILVGWAEGFLIYRRKAGT